EQVVERRLRILVHAGVDVGRLDDGAARRDQPVEARALRESADGAPLAAPLADFRDGVEVALDHREIDGRRESLEPLAIELDAAAEKPAGWAEDDHAGVEELAAVDARHHAHHGVIKDEAFGHERPPPSSPAAPPVAPSATHDKPYGGDLR